MRATAGLKCPECGREAKGERGLGRTRRRWRTAALAAVLMMAGAMTAVAPKVRREGWWSVVPTRAAAVALGYSSGGGAVDMELRRRLGIVPTAAGVRRPMEEAELAGLVRRVLAGAPGARPGSARWEQTYGGLWDAMRGVAWVMSAKPTELQISGAAYGPAVIAAFDEALKLPLDVTVRARERIPEGAGLPIEATVKHRWPQWWMDDSVLKWNDGEKERSDGFRGYRTLPVRGSGEVEVKGALVTRAENLLDRRVEEVDARPVVIRTRVEPKGTELLEAVKSEELDRLLASSVRVELREGAPGVWPGTAADPAYGDCVFAMTYEVWEGETRLLTGKARWLGLTGTMSGASCGSIESDLKWEALTKRLKEGGPFVVRMKSDPVLGLLSLDAVRRWEGSFEVEVKKGEGGVRSLWKR